MNKLIIPGGLTDLNTYIQAERGNRYSAADMKKTNTQICTLYAKRLQPITKRVQVNFTWYCANEKKDPDNICFAKKYILDGLVKAGVLANDGWKQIKGFTDNFEVDKVNPRIEIEFIEV
jgi:Holliday junction resolvase RusA-like endonuclease